MKSIFTKLALLAAVTAPALAQAAEGAGASQGKGLAVIGRLLLGNLF